jgi:hypothetical protein
MPKLNKVGCPASLPELGEKVLLLDTSGCFEVGYLRLLDNRRKAWGVGYFQHKYREFEAVTHWAKLPKIKSKGMVEC